MNHALHLLPQLCHWLSHICKPHILKLQPQDLREALHSGLGLQRGN